MPDFTYPTNVAMRRIAQQREPLLLQDDPIDEIFPIEEVDEDRLVWEQMDDWNGMQQIRGYDGDFPRVKKTGAKTYDMEPGVYGEHEGITEKEIIKRRPYGEYSGSMPIDNLVLELDEKLHSREITLINYLRWQAVVSGTLSVIGPDNAILWAATFTPLTYDASDWTNRSTGTPILDFTNAIELAEGTSSMFGPEATAFMTSTTFINMRLNGNAADLGGRRSMGLGTINNINQINELMMGDGLPKIVPYNGGYADESGTWHRHIPNNMVVIVGKRPNGQRLGEYRKTKNANLPNAAPGSSVHVHDSILETKKPPRKIEVYRGHNGGPVLFFGSAVIRMAVGP